MNLFKSKLSVIAILALGASFSASSAQANQYRTLCKIGKIEIDYFLKGEKSQQYVRVTGLTDKPVAIGAVGADLFDARVTPGPVEGSTTKIVAKSGGSTQSVKLTVNSNGDEDTITLEISAPEGDQKGAIGQMSFSGAYYCI